jgi:dipeptidyl aminopeptidase/acylaminoacyl peptidase
MKAVQLMAYDPTNRTSTKLVRYFLPSKVGDFSYSPEGIGIINDGNGLYEQLAWIRQRRLVRLRLPFDRVGYPSWSPDGGWIAVDAAPAGHDAQGLSRLDLPRNLYLLTRDGKVARLLVPNLANAGGSSWSPDGQWLTLALKPRDAPEGLWLVHAASGRRFLLLPGRQFGGTAWLPGGRRLIAAVGIFSTLPYADETYGKSDVGLYDIRLPNLGRLVPK